MGKLILILLLLVYAIGSYSQSVEKRATFKVKKAQNQTNIEIDEDENNVIDVDVVEEQPTFPGGDRAMVEFIGRNLVYPKEAIENRIEGKVIVSFIISENGRVEKVTVLRGVHPLLDKEALRVVKSFPVWKPAQSMGRAVAVQYAVPIRFKFQ